MAASNSFNAYPTSVLEKRSDNKLSNYAQKSLGAKNNKGARSYASTLAFDLLFATRKAQLADAHEINPSTVDFISVLCAMVKHDCRVNVYSASACRKYALETATKLNNRCEAWLLDQVEKLDNEYKAYPQLR